MNFVDMYKDAQSAGVMVIGLRNVLSDKEVEQRLVENNALEKYNH